MVLYVFLSLQFSLLRRTSLKEKKNNKSHWSKCTFLSGFRWNWTTMCTSLNFKCAFFYSRYCAESKLRFVGMIELIHRTIKRISLIFSEQESMRYASLNPCLNEIWNLRIYFHIRVKHCYSFHCHIFLINFDRISTGYSNRLFLTLFTLNFLLCMYCKFETQSEQRVAKPVVFNSNCCNRVLR